MVKNRGIQLRSEGVIGDEGLQLSDVELSGVVMMKTARGYSDF